MIWRLLRQWNVRQVPDWIEGIGMDLLMLLLLPAAGLWMGRTLFVNRMARQFIAMSLCLLTGNLIADLLIVARGWDPIAALVNGGILMATGLAIIAVSGGGFLWLAAAIQLAGAGAVAAFPLSSKGIMPTSTVLTLFALGAWARRQMREL